MQNIMNAITVSNFSPLTFMVDMLRFAINGNNYFALSLDIFASILWIIALLIINNFIHKKTVLRRFSSRQKGMMKKNN